MIAAIAPARITGPRKGQIVLMISKIVSMSPFLFRNPRRLVARPLRGMIFPKIETMTACKAPGSFPQVLQPLFSPRPGFGPAETVFSNKRLSERVKGLRLLSREKENLIRCGCPAVVNAPILLVKGLWI